MSFRDFEARYGASFRTKHIVVLPSSVRDLPRFAARVVRGRMIRRKPFYAAPREAVLPRMFIGLDPWEAEFLFCVASRARSGILEIGRLHGGSTFVLACANQEVPIWSIDIRPRDDALLERLLAENGVGQNVELLVGDSQRGEFPEVGEYDVLFIDGDHSYDGVWRDLKRHFPGLLPGGHLLLHDSYSGISVQPAILDFAARHDVTPIRAAEIPWAHWRTAQGSIAHLMKSS